MFINVLKEFLCMVDMLASIVEEGDTLVIDLEYSGTVKKTTAEGRKYANVNGAQARVAVSYDLNGFNISSTTAKKVNEWLSDSVPGTYKKTNAYLTFIHSITSIEITSIKYNGVEILNCLSDSSGSGLDICKLCKYVAKDRDIRITLSNGERMMTFNYTDSSNTPYFTRFVKMKNKKNILYLNSEEYMCNFTKTFHLASYTFCRSLPDIISQIEIFRSISEKENCEFAYVER